MQEEKGAVMKTTTAMVRGVRNHKRECSLLPRASRVRYGACMSLILHKIEEGVLSYSLVMAQLEAIKRGHVITPVRSAHRPYIPFEMDVDYSASTKAMVKVCRFGCVDANITDTNFPPVSSRGIERVHAGVFRFPHNMSTEDVVSKMNYFGFDPSIMCEHLHFSARFPYALTVHPLISLGAIVRVGACDGSGGVDCVAYSIADGSDRDLGLNLLEEQWSPDNQFLGVRSKR